ncbi:hypothetical protein ACFWBN_33810 [Streptomyces sp. NPDC059989]|uniref:hypothetical protein n=1 Tax=Streptomyces sp. NPDC059989 TaxID=3347026 RepID=UPI00368C82BE
MKLTRTFATVCTTAATAVILSAGGAAADGELVSALNNPAVGAACFPSGQVGSGNTFNGTQNISCSQSTDQTITNPAPAADGGVTGREEVFAAGVTVEPGLTSGAAAMCPEGKVPTGGGFQRGPFASHWDSIESAPTESGDGTRGWQTSARNAGTVPGAFHAWAVCVDEAP